MARWTSGQSCHPFTVENVSSNLTRVIYARVFRRGSGADCKSVGLGFEWFESLTLRSRYNMEVNFNEVTL